MLTLVVQTVTIGL